MDLLYLLFLGFVSAISITIEDDSKNAVWKGDSINGYNFKQDAIGNIVITANTENNGRTRLQRITDRKPGSSMCFLNMVPGYKANALQENIMKTRECFPISNVMRFMNSNSNYLLYIDDTSMTYYGEDSSVRRISKENYYISSFRSKVLCITTHISNLDISDEQMKYIPDNEIRYLSATTDKFVALNPSDKKFENQVNYWIQYLSSKNKLISIEGKQALDIETIVKEGKCTGLEGQIIGLIHNNKFILVDINGTICEVNIPLVGK